MRKDPRIGLHYYVIYRLSRPKDHTHSFFMGQLVSTKGGYYTFRSKEVSRMGEEKKKVRRVKKSNVEEMKGIERDKLVEFCGKCGIILQVLAKWKKDPKLRELEFSPREWQDLASTMIIGAKEFI